MQCRREGTGIFFLAPAVLEPRGSIVLTIPRSLHLISSLLDRSAQQRWEWPADIHRELLKSLHCSLLERTLLSESWSQIILTQPLISRFCTQVTLTAHKGILLVLSFVNKRQGRSNVLKSVWQRHQT